jgi:hypothetical protein
MIALFALGQGMSLLGGNSIISSVHLLEIGDVLAVKALCSVLCSSLSGSVNAPSVGSALHFCLDRPSLAASLSYLVGVD